MLNLFQSLAMKKHFGDPGFIRHLGGKHTAGRILQIIKTQSPVGKKQRKKLRKISSNARRINRD